MATSELIIPVKDIAHKTGKDFKGVGKTRIHMGIGKKAERKVKPAASPKKVRKISMKIAGPINMDNCEYEFFDADNLNLHAPPISMEEVEIEIIEEKKR